MKETTEQQQLRMAAYMAAVAQILGGREVDRSGFIDKVELIMSGSAVNMTTLLSWRQRVRQTGRPILLFSPTEEPAVPLISLVAHVGKRTHVVESCMLWLGDGHDRARLVPDNMKCGAFVFDDDLSMRHLKRVPAVSLDAAAPGMGRAYNRLLDLEIERRAECSNLALPSLQRWAS